MSTQTELKNYYANLLITQYRNKSKAVATVKCLVNQATCEGLALQLSTAFSLETAIGEQLTILGKIVGVPRNIYGLDLTHTFFSLTSYYGTPPSVGFGRYTDSPYSSDIFLRYKNFGIYTLTDFEMRALIKLKIIFNNTYSSFKNIKDALYLYFAGAIDIGNPEINFDTTGVYFTFTRYGGTPASNGFGRYTSSPYPNGTQFYRYRNYSNMVMTYLVDTAYTRVIQSAQFLGVVPRPAGVKLNITFK